MPSSTNTRVDHIRSEMRLIANPEVAASSARYFQTKPGQYGENDVFIGISVPVIRQFVEQFKDITLEETESLLSSPVHEERLLALLLLVRSVTKCDGSNRKVVYDFYMNNRSYVNNWDLVDTSAPTIVGGYLTDRSRAPLHRLLKSKRLWDRRIAIIATLHFIRQSDLEETFRISKLLLHDVEPLIHKAVGWMLREAGKRDRSQLTAFLDVYASTMPRTMLRYSIEKFDLESRQHYMQLR